MSDNQSIPLVSVKNLTCTKQDRILFEQLNFDIYAGDIVIIGGANGAGKTSLLRILAGLSEPTEGVIHYRNDPLFYVIEQFKQDLLYIGHAAGIKSELTAQENLTFYMALKGNNHDNALSHLKKIGLYAFEDAHASTLSAGQKRRIALAQMWEHNEKVWILDEPLTAIDAKGVAALEQQIITHAESGGCVIMTTHQPLSIDPARLTHLNLAYRF